jgi:DNA-binding response OmpR family regulator
MAAREANAPQKLRSDLHRLSNAVRFTTWQSGATGNSLRHLTQVLSRLPLDLADQLDEGLGSLLRGLQQTLGPPLREAVSTGDSTPLATALRQSEDALRDLSQALGELRAAEQPSGRSPVQRILVVEDEPNWREAIVGLLGALGLGDLTESAADARQAREKLAAGPEGTLALVDLGLPDGDDRDKAGSTVNLSAGLDLIAEFARKRPGMRFVVLTGASNYADAVRATLAAGVDPWDYLQKGPHWQEQLRTRVRVALAPVPPRTPLAYVFRSTARLVRVDGVEVELDRKPFIVFDYLAAAAPRWCTVGQMRTSLTSPGRHDVTPPMSKEVEEQALRGEIPFPTPYELLTEARLQDYVYELRQSLGEALRVAGRPVRPAELVQYRDDPPAYRVNARCQLVESFEDFVAESRQRSVLVVEDDPPWAEALLSSLSRLGFDVRLAATLEDACRLLAESAPDLVSLDLQIPETKGALSDEANSLTFLERLAEEAPTARVAVLTSIAWNDAVMLDLLRRGIQVADYLSKQWDEPIERLGRSLWRLSLESERGARIAGADEGLKLHRVELDPASPETFRVDGHAVRLTAGPGRVLAVLARSRNAPVDRELLMQALWPDPNDWPEDADGALNTIIRRLRSTIANAVGDSEAGKAVIRGKGGVYWLQGVVQ